MKLPTTTNYTFGLFSVVLFLCIILPNQLMGTVGLVLLLFVTLLGFRMVLSAVNTYFIFVLPWITWIGYLMCSLPFSTVIPSSLHILAWHWVYFLSFFYLLGVFQNQRSTVIALNRQLQLLLTVGAIISISMFFVGVPPFVSNIVSNFAYSYGHNHFGAMLLLFFPLVVHQALYHKKRKNIVIAIVWMLVIVLSAGRALLIVALLQTCLVFVVFRGHSKRFRVIVWSFLFTFLALTISWFVLFNQKTHYCRAHQYSLFCKRTDQVRRVEYWQQALEVVREHPLLGSGLGTFVHASQKYWQSQIDQTTYAHNVVLEVLAETGIVGGIVLCILIASITIWFIRARKQGFDPTQKVLIIGLIGSGLNAMVDFDWSVPSQFILVIVVLALIISRTKRSEPYFHGLARHARLVTGVIIVFVSSVMLMYSAVALLQQGLITTHTVATAFKLCPYCYPAERVALNALVEDGQFNVPLANQVFFNVPMYWQVSIFSPQDDNGDNFSELAAQRLTELQPVSRIYSWLPRYYLQAHRYHSAIVEYQQVVDLLAKLSRTQGKSFPKYYYWKIDNDVRLAVQQLYLAGEYVQAYEGTKLLLEINSERLMQIDPPFSYAQSLDLAELSYFDRLLSQNPPLGSRSGLYKSRLERLLAQALLENAYDSARLAVSALQTIDPEDRSYSRIAIRHAVDNPDSVCNLPTQDQCQKNLDALINLLMDRRNFEQLDLSYEDRLFFVRLFFAHVDQLDLGDAQVEQLVATSAKLAPNNYWVAAQPGNLYAALGQSDQAIRSFNQCLHQFGNQHDDCAFGKKMVESGGQYSERFGQTTKIILGQKRWQDFQ